MRADGPLQVFRGDVGAVGPDQGVEFGVYREPLGAAVAEPTPDSSYALPGSSPISANWVIRTAPSGKRAMISRSPPSAWM